ncbi:radical SAM protein [Clostridium felsineum]|uniref:radical SAM protein n=1 Tax=Clostridium felsineum TaxID=36839 RepID=UPI00098C6A48|nr:radical SAM protein [Clostridium felsineum]
MMKNFNLESYLSDGVQKIVKRIIKSTLSNPKESLFMAKYSAASKNAIKLRAAAAKKGEHVPPFLIASITSKCNLHCKGCYARHVNSCTDEETVNQLKDEDWRKIFHEANNMGVGFILLLGGEPLMRPNVIKMAGEIQDILFPIFTNGTMINEEYIKLFKKYRNLIPIFSIEGNENNTDDRRGKGIFTKIIKKMNEIYENNIIYGASITVTKDNLKEVTSQKFLDELYNKGCKSVIYVEYVPVSEDTKKLALNDEREFLEEKLVQIRNKYKDMLFVSFPGDEKSSGGCLAAGRGFFHINYNGGVEPCPFSPYSDTNLKNTPLKEAINSPLFKKLRSNSMLIEEHSGGCVLFEKEEVVQSLLQKE